MPCFRFFFFRTKSQLLREGPQSSVRRCKFNRSVPSVVSNAKKTLVRLDAYVVVYRFSFIYFFRIYQDKDIREISVTRASWIFKLRPLHQVTFFFRSFFSPIFYRNVICKKKKKKRRHFTPRPELLSMLRRLFQTYPYDSIYLKENESKETCFFFPLVDFSTCTDISPNTIYRCRLVSYRSLTRKSQYVETLSVCTFHPTGQNKYQTQYISISKSCLYLLFHLKLPRRIRANVLQLLGAK